MSEESVVSLVEKKILEMKKKANHNKWEALWGVRVIIFFGMLAPMLIAFGQGIIWGKVLPSGLSLLAAIFTAWLQIRKPQELWCIYRTSQRKMEAELEFYQYSVCYYNIVKEEKDKILIKRVSDIYLSTHSQWSDLVPTSKEINNIMSINNKEQQ